MQGRAPLLYCRFHGWRYKLDGSLHSATRKDLLLDFDADSCRVPAIQCEVWEGFIFINLNPHNTESLRSYLGELAHGLEGYPFDGAAPGVSVQGRIAVQLEDLRRRLRGELPRPLSACVVVRRSHRGGQGCVRPTEPVHRCAGISTQGSAPDVLLRGGAVTKDAVLQADRMRDGGQRGGPVEQEAQSGTHATGYQPDPCREVWLRFVPVLPEFRIDLRRIRFHGAHPLAHGSAFAHLRNRGLLPATDHSSGTAGPGTDDDVPQRHHPGGRQPIGRVTGDAEQRRADAFHDERRGDPPASPAQDGRRLCRGGGGGTIE